MEESSTSLFLRKRGETVCFEASSVALQRDVLLFVEADRSGHQKLPWYFFEHHVETVQSISFQKLPINMQCRCIQYHVVHTASILLSHCAHFFIKQSSHFLWPRCLASPEQFHSFVVEGLKWRKCDILWRAILSHKGQECSDQCFHKPNSFFFFCWAWRYKSEKRRYSSVK